MKILACDKVDPAALARLREAGHEVVEGNALQGKDLVAALAGAHGLLVRGATKLTADVIDAVKDLRVVVRAGTGLDNVDLEAATMRGIVVRNTPNANSVSVAELTFAMALALERHVVAAASDLKRGVWEKSRYQGRELAGRTIGILGFGRIGREVAARARSFAMHVLWHDPLFNSTPAGFVWAEKADREALFRRADVLTLHVPFTPDTRDSIGATELAWMKKDAILVNVARGGVVVESALVAALNSGALRGAAVDVFSEEPPPADHPLLSMPNVLPLPHLGASTAEAQRRAGHEAVDILLAELALR